MLRTGKIALNTFKNIHLQSNIFESPKEGTGRWWGGCSWAPSPGAAGVLGTCQWHPLTASFWATDLASWPQYLWPFTKGKGRLVLPSNSQEQPLLSSLWSWPRRWSKRQAKGCRRAKQCSLWKEVIFSPPGEESLFLLSNFSALDFAQEKILAASLTKISVPFYKRTLNSSPEWLLWNCWVS